jgi:CubicO group peptidase (beta-lactamase class C family)
MAFGLSRGFWVTLVVILVVTAAIILLAPLYRVALLGSGYMAHTLCSGMFVSGRDLNDVMTQELSGAGSGELAYFQAAPDHHARTVSASAYGFAAQTAIFRDGLGCTLIDGKSEAELRAQAADLFPARSAPNNEAAWPLGKHVAAWVVPETVNGEAVTKTIDDIFAERDPVRPRRTRALVVVHGGRIVAERYAPGFDAHMPLIGWSMAKTAVNALVGMRVKDGVIALNDDALMPEWHAENDPRRAITLGELMNMTSGLEFDESHGNLSDASQMLFVQGDAARFAASKPLIHAPGTHWSYSSGTTTIIDSILRGTFAHEHDYLHFPVERLFGPLGMTSAVLEPDASGTFVGSSFLYASARDWARLGLLFLQDGVWNGTRLLPEGWVDYSLEPTMLSPHGQYGAQIWLKLTNTPNQGEPPMPEDAYYMLGFNGQAVVVVPSRDLVVVRLGLTPEGGDWHTGRDLAPLVNAFSDRPH